MKKSIRFLSPYARGNIHYLMVSMVLSFISTIAGIAPFLIMYYFIEVGYAGDFSAQTITSGVVVLTICAVAGFFSKTFSIVASHKVAYGVLSAIRKKVCTHLANVPMGYFNTSSSSAIKKVLTEDTVQIEVFLAHHLPDLFSAFFSVIILCAYLITMNWQLGIISLLPLLLIPWLQKSMAKGASERMSKWISVVTKLNGSVIEFIKGIAIIKIFNLKLDSAKHYTGVIDEYCAVWTEITKSQGPSFAIFTVLTQCPIVLIMPMGAILYFTGLISGTTYILFCILSCVYLSSLKSLAFFTTDLAYLTSNATKVEEILNTPIIKQATICKTPKNNSISFKNVSFGYSEKQVLHNVSFEVKSGENVAIIGESGAGKSTILQLLLRFWDISDGTIYIGKVDIKEMHQSELMGNLAYVSQDVFVENESIFANIKIGKKSATSDDIYNSAQYAQIHNTIIELPEKYDTVIGRNGRHLSGGEKQRISIARAFLKDAPILLLDEATASADVENELLIKQSLEKLSLNKTLLTIVHRLNDIENYDKILLLKDGKVEAFGSFEEILKTSTAFNAMWGKYKRANSLIKGGYKNV